MMDSLRSLADNVLWYTPKKMKRRRYARRLYYQIRCEVFLVQADDFNTAVVSAAFSGLVVILGLVWTITLSDQPRLIDTLQNHMVNDSLRALL